MNKKVLFRILLALIAYAVFVVLVVMFYKDSPADMKWEDRELYNRQYIAALKIDNFNFEQALTDLGTPDLTEAKKVGIDNYQVLFYRTQHVKSDGITTQEECTPLLFKNDQLIAIGEPAYQVFRELS
ncbi:DUF3192 domain-containing protein [Thalassotalea agarivorans]|uniref:DUF3192 domain-containing protein n=1 Tax=Thalassotalea agarivorans TaxID=349064 RepID=A0A1I0FEX9_THASX|nr:DUF3192 domain-containing protein [Thalassotalea agarivorans]SET56748.1 Protein of unknown function [Thalassotalea agarivorans]